VTTSILLPPALTMKDFPGMAQVCLSHEMAYRRYGDLTWRKGGTANCICELRTDAMVRLRAGIEWAKRDEETARDRRKELERELRAMET
jgi:hypothetical protein